MGTFLDTFIRMADQHANFVENPDKNFAKLQVSACITSKLGSKQNYAFNIEDLSSGNVKNVLVSLKCMREKLNDELSILVEKEKELNANAENNSNKSHVIEEEYGDDEDDDDSIDNLDNTQPVQKKSKLV